MRPPARVHTQTIAGFYWDHPNAKKPRSEHNVYHILDKHRVSTDEVEEVIEGFPVLLDVQAADGESPVYGVVGFTAGGRMLEIWGMVFQRHPYVGMWRNITAMDADDDAKERYYRERGASR